MLKATIRIATTRAGKINTCGAVNILDWPLDNREPTDATGPVLKLIIPKYDKLASLNITEGMYNTPWVINGPTELG